MRQFDLAIYNEDSDGNVVITDEEFIFNYSVARKRAEFLSKSSNMVHMIACWIDDNKKESVECIDDLEPEWFEKYVDGKQVQILPKVWRYGEAIMKAIGTFADNEALKRLKHQRKK